MPQEVLGLMEIESPVFRRYHSCNIRVTSLDIFTNLRSWSPADHIFVLSVVFTLRLFPAPQRVSRAYCVWVIVAA